MTNTYDIGNVAILSASFVNANGVLTDPTTVVLRYKDPTGAVTTQTPTHDGTGLYSYALTLSIAGKWFYRFEGTGAVIAASDSSLLVTNSPTLGC